MSVRRVDEGYKVTNGPTFSPKQGFMYHTDTGVKTIYRFDLSPEGELSNKKEWLKFTGDMGSPDGMTTDAEGYDVDRALGRLTNQSVVAGRETGSRDSIAGAADY